MGTYLIKQVLYVHMTRGYQFLNIMYYPWMLRNVKNMNFVSPISLPTKEIVKVFISTWVHGLSSVRHIYIHSICVGISMFLYDQVILMNILGQVFRENGNNTTYLDVCNQFLCMQLISRTTQYIHHGRSEDLSVTPLDGRHGMTAVNITIQY